MKIKILYKDIGSNNSNKKIRIGVFIASGLIITLSTIYSLFQEWSYIKAVYLIIGLIFMTIMPILIWREKRHLEEVIECKSFEVIKSGG